MSAEPYPHRYLRETVLTGAGWEYRCRCGLGSPYGGERERDCPAAMREEIARILAETEDARRLGASIHKAASAAVDAERAAVVKWLRRPCEDSDHHPAWCYVCGQRVDEGDDIERGEHIAKETT